MRSSTEESRYESRKEDPSMKMQSYSPLIFRWQPDIEIAGKSKASVRGSHRGPDSWSVIRESFTVGNLISARHVGIADDTQGLARRILARQASQWTYLSRIFRNWRNSTSRHHGHWRDEFCPWMGLWTFRAYSVSVYIALIRADIRSSLGRVPNLSAMPVRISITYRAYLAYL